MRVSVIIVNYNVVYFLEQCLFTVRQAVSGLEAEIIVVDNASTDESRALLPIRYPEVHFIWNEKNPGFGAANNQAMAIAKGEYFLLLNPDTLLPPESLKTCLAFFASHPEAGALGMRMYDGQGNYLPESKRGLPDLMTALYKLSGLIKLFPRHPKIARYYLGHLSAEKVQEVDILAGAFMMLSRKAYAQVGGFDEQFFMYGEDIDLSHRIRLAGYKNYYLPEPGLIHFKGESTPRNFAYTRHFYKAMLIFTRKYSGKSLRNADFLVGTGVYILGFFAALGNWWSKMKATTPAQIQWELKGDPVAIRELESGFTDAHQAGSPLQPGFISGTLHALGETYNVQDVLNSWQKNRPSGPQRFHGKGTRSLVGSEDKHKAGFAVALKNPPPISAFSDIGG